MADNLDIDVGSNTDYRKLLALQLMQPQPAARSFGEGLLQGLRGAAGAGMLMYQGQQDEEKRKKLADAIANSGGDIEALKGSDVPGAQELYSKVLMRRAMEKPVNPSWQSFTVGDKSLAGWADPSSQKFTPVYSGENPSAAKPPPTRSYKSGDKEITQEYDPNTKTWRDLASAPRQEPPAPVWKQDASGNWRQVSEGMPGMTPNGVTITNPDGTVTQIGGKSTVGGANPTLGAPVVNKIDEELKNNFSRLGRVGDIIKNADPKYMSYAYQAGDTMRNVSSKLGMSSADADAEIAKYATFKSSAMNDLNQVLKEMSGGAVTPQEAERQLQVLANAKADSWPEFKAKILQTQRMITQSTARLIRLRSMGIQPKFDSKGNVMSFNGEPLDRDPVKVSGPDDPIVKSLRPGTLVEDKQGNLGYAE